VIPWLLRLGLGGLFAAAGALKLRDPSAFATEISNYRFLPSLAPWLAATLPMIELILGLALIAGPAPWRRGAALASVGLLAVFTAALTQALARGISIDCGCFGGASGPVSGLTLLRDVALLGAAVALLFVDQAAASTARRTAS
jgi:uncharacterized membrane protein YphA (DoxX/SURF4 family)